MSPLSVHPDKRIMPQGVSDAKKQTFTKEYKLEAVHLLETSDNQRPMWRGSRRFGEICSTNGKSNFGPKLKWRFLVKAAAPRRMINSPD